MTPGKPPSSTASSNGSTLTSLHFRRLELTLSKGSPREQDYTFFWQGKEPGKPRMNAVGFEVRNSLLSSIEPPSEDKPCIISLRLSTPSGPLNILSIYAPTLCSSAEVKDEFYEIWRQPSRSSPPLNSCSCSGPSTAVWELTTTLSPIASTTLVLASWIRVGRSYRNFALTTIST